MKPFILKILIFAFLGSCLFAAVEIIGRSLNVAKRPVFNINAKSQNLVPQIDPNTILFVGDSRIEWGIKPAEFLKAFSSEDHLKAINLAFTDSNGFDVLRYLKNNNIHPKIIIIGHSPNACWYLNHGLDSEVYSKPRKLYLNARNYFYSNFLISDNSIYQYFKNGPLTIKRMEYGKWGGVSTSLNVDYQEAKRRQILMYTSWQAKITKAKAESHKATLNEFIDYFQANQTRVIGLYMPVEKELFSIENAVYSASGINWNKFYDYSDHFAQQENLNRYFLDGSHLRPDYSRQFSKMLGQVLSESL